MGKKIIQLVNVWKIYQLGNVQVEALRGMDLTISCGEFVSIMGPSGSGKSTSVNMVGCLDIPTKGEIYLDGHNIAHLHENDLAKIRGEKIGFVFQQFNLIPTLNAVENVALPMVFQGKSRRERIERATSLLTRVGLGDRLTHQPSELSGGEQQRVAIARALSNDPEVILADEPTGNLDTKTGSEIMMYLQKLHKDQSKTIIMVTHDPKIAHLADRIVHLQDGKVVSKT